MILVTVLLLLMTARVALGIEAPPTKAAPLLARTLPEVETVILQALVAANLTERLTWIAAETNGHLTIGRLVLTYPADLTDPVLMLQTRAWDLVRTIFTAVPSLNEIHHHHPNLTLLTAQEVEDELRRTPEVIAPHDTHPPSCDAL